VLVELVSRSIAEWNADLEQLIFGTADPAGVAQAIEALVVAHVGPVDGAVFYRTGVGIVAGLRLVDGREVVFKAHRWQVSLARLRAIHEVQACVADAGLPAPRPIVAPQVVGAAIATVDELLAGEPVAGHDPQVRGVLAEGLHAFVAAARPLAGRVAVGAPPILQPAGGSPWPEPHSIRFDFVSTASGAEWIDAFGAQARARLQHLHGDVVIGHFDWRVENLGFREARIVAIYDWDSVASAPEPIVVGAAAAQFTADWSEPNPLPTLAEMAAFVADYEHARQKSFNRRERELLDAANLMRCAYGARCQHSDIALHPELGGTAKTTGWQRLLLERGDRGLA
jgi:hypothetical protein